MAENELKPDIPDLWPDAEPTSPAGKRRTTTGTSKRTRTSYDLPLGMREELREIGYSYRTSASSVVAYFLSEAIKQYKAGKLPIEPHLVDSKSLKFLHDIEIDYPTD